MFYRIITAAKIQLQDIWGSKGSADTQFLILKQQIIKHLEPDLDLTDLDR